MHREQPLDNHALEKSGQERPKGLKSWSEMAPRGVGFERERAGKPGPFREALNMEKKVRGLAGGAVGIRTHNGASVRPAMEWLTRANVRNGMIRSST
jgi:hypothetical protein